MINTLEFYNHLIKNNITFFSGVPDSLLKDFCACVYDNSKGNSHIIASNEGASIGLGVGHYLATKNIPFIYMQNSGFGNSINPILSIADDLVYGIPMIIMMGWRGEPNMSDEPQHIRQGMVNEKMLQSMDIPYVVVDENSSINVINLAIKTSKKISKPFVLLVKKNTFSKYQLINKDIASYELNREEAIKLIINSLDETDVVVSTTGKASREVFEYRKALNQGHEKDFLTVGAMGHASSIAIGIALKTPNKNIYCIDGDGSVIMHMGTLAVNGSLNNLNNFKHIIINNGAHDSVGGQPTVGFEIDFVSIAKACGYTFSNSAETKKEIIKKLKILSEHKGIGLLEIKVNKGAREGLGRPTNSPLDNKNLFQKFLLNEKKIS